MGAPESFKRDILAEANEGMLFLDHGEFDEALVGYAERFGMGPVAAYNYDTLIEVLMAEGMSTEEAVEHFEYNIIGSWVGEATPVFIHGL